MSTTVVRRPAHANAVVLAHGYTGRDVARIASFAVRQARSELFDSGQQYDVAWSAIAEALWNCTEPPDAKTLYRAGIRAIHDEGRSLARGRGVWQKDAPIKRFDTYWRTVERQPREEHPVVERIAAIQVYDGLPDIHQWTLWALTVADDEDGAAARSWASLPAHFIDGCGKPAELRKACGFHRIDRRAISCGVGDAP
ncbi:hypothetical protein [Streptomyces hainanensis]|uniref:Uncharacterized protein n=1 Tax=Streptomyces hainanensis TaxID=402648 RepID=A0A4R4TIC5_9ACTN|nr:hypothetical protein [Streptomyces hainanensis]TDC77501.1 hypothetical protein E1283_07125 [Streptomyces hainanensis]